MKKCNPRKILRICVQCVGVAYFGFFGILDGWCQSPLVSISDEIHQGFDYAWKHQFRRADQSFQRVLSTDPENKEAHKGLAYVNLYKGNGKKAESMFLDLQLKYPEESEFQIALAIALLQQNYVNRAADSLQKIIQHHPYHLEARKLLSNLALQPAFLEVTAWGGYTKWKGESTTGLRMAQLSAQPNKKTRLWVRYDNTMSLDNNSLASRHQYAPAFFAGGLYAHRPELLTRLEVGERFLGNGIRQKLIQGEQVVHLAKPLSIKAGGMYGMRNDGVPEKMFFVGGESQLTPVYSLEVIRFQTNFQAKNFNEVRWLTQAHVHLPHETKLILGGFIGKTQNSFLANPNWGLHTLLSLKVNNNYNLGFLARIETDSQDQFIVLSAGLSRKIHR